MNFTKLRNQLPYVYLMYLKMLTIYRIIKINRLKNYDDQKKKEYIKKIYKKRTGNELNWEHLESYTEKMQWAKLYDSTIDKAICADKYLVRDWIKDKIGDEYLINLLGVWDNPDDIDFSALPNSFVLKTNNGSSTNIIVKNKNDINISVIKARLRCWLQTDMSYIKGFELHYPLIKPKIIAEEYIDYPGNDLPDYKFICFHDEVYYCWVDIDRYHNHKRNIYDLDWNLQPWNQHDYGNSNFEIDKPKNFEDMVSIARILCKGFSHVRVDLYNIDGKIYFGEMTFTNGSGYELIKPEEYNVLLGNMWKLDNEEI